MIDIADDEEAEDTRPYAHAAPVKRYPVGKGSIRFSADKALPAALVANLVRARVAENEKRSS